MSRDSELERIGLNEDSKNRINDWMRRATSREFKAAQAMSSIHSMMIDAVNDINRAMYPISQFTDRTVADDQMLAWYLDRIFKAIYDESSVSSFVLEDMSREKGADFVQLNPEQTERWYDSVKDLSDTMAALFADAIEFSSVNSKMHREKQQMEDSQFMALISFTVGLKIQDPITKMLNGLLNLEQNNRLSHCMKCMKNHQMFTGGKIVVAIYQPMSQ
jgi:hypothetical protein